MPGKRKAIRARLIYSFGGGNRCAGVIENKGEQKDR
jgi:hypothetical protein